MMTDDEQEIFAKLKFNGLQDVMNSFKTAVGVPSWANTTDADTAIVMQVYEYWLEAGAPEHYEILPDHAETILKLKFGSVDAAWDYVMSRPPGESHGLSEHEINLVMDYAKPLNV